MYDARSVAIFRGGVDDPIEPISTCKPDKLDFSQEDEEKVIQKLLALLQFVK